MSHTLDLFAAPAAPPEGFRYQSDLIDGAQERALIAELEKLNFSAFQFHGFEGKRRVVSFGWGYDFNGGGLQESVRYRRFSCRCGSLRLHPLSWTHRPCSRCF
jgi:hypothetical protein